MIWYQSSFQKECRFLLDALSSSLNEAKMHIITTLAVEVNFSPKTWQNSHSWSDWGLQVVTMLWYDMSSLQTSIASKFTKYIAICASSEISQSLSLHSWEFNDWQRSDENFLTEFSGQAVVGDHKILWLINNT